MKIGKLISLVIVLLLMSVLIAPGLSTLYGGSIEGDNRVFITKGLGFLSDAITDQHFFKRGRLGRLIVAAIVHA